MKVVIARLNHETNTFSPLPTPLAAFGAGDPHGPSFGKDAHTAARGSATAMGAFIDMAERKGCEIVTPLFAMAMMVHMHKRLSQRRVEFQEPKRA